MNMVVPSANVFPACLPMATVRGRDGSTSAVACGRLRGAHTHAALAAVLTGWTWEDGRFTSPTGDATVQPVAGEPGVWWAAVAG